jgi:UPF0755 protein
MIRRLFFWTLLLILTAGGSLAYYSFRPLALDTLPLEFDLKRGSSLKVAAQDLQQAGVLSQSWPFVILVRLMGAAGELKAGSYSLTHAVSPYELAQMITRGDVNLRQVQVIEGWTFRQMRAALDANSYLAHDSQQMSDAELMQAIGAPEAHPEGLFFPDTYHFATGTSDLDILRHAYETMQQRLQAAWQSRDPELPLASPYQALILASIVEKETGAPFDRTKIAGVFVNRLRIGMMLQTDPSVIYGIGPQFDGNLRKRDLVQDTPYNTYRRAGLTPTPIALPSADALNAAMHPAHIDALYFVSRGDGSSYFSRNLNEHNRAVNRYQR